MRDDQKKGTAETGLGEKGPDRMDKMEYAAYDSPLGEIVMASDGRALKELWLPGQRGYEHGRKGLSGQKENLVFTRTRAWLDQYFAGEIPGELPALTLEGSAFRKRVWQILLEIPYGQVRTYGEIAAQLAAETGKKRMAAQAVGGAVGHNPISILIPCHRVVGKDGSLVGYGGGLEKKVFLLKLENHIF